MVTEKSFNQGVISDELYGLLGDKNTFSENNKQKLVELFDKFLTKSDQLSNDELILFMQLVSSFVFGEFQGINTPSFTIRQINTSIGSAFACMSYSNQFNTLSINPAFVDEIKQNKAGSKFEFFDCLLHEYSHFLHRQLLAFYKKQLHTLSEEKIRNVLTTDIEKVYGQDNSGVINAINFISSISQEKSQEEKEELFLRIAINYFLRVEKYNISTKNNEDKENTIKQIKANIEDFISGNNDGSHNDASDNYYLSKFKKFREDLKDYKNLLSKLKYYNYLYRGFERAARFDSIFRLKQLSEKMKNQELPASVKDFIEKDLIEGREKLISSEKYYKKYNYTLLDAVVEEYNNYLLVQSKTEKL